MANLDFIRNTALIIASLLGTSAPIYSKEGSSKTIAKTPLSAENELPINVELPRCDIKSVSLNNCSPALGIVGGRKDDTHEDYGSAYAAFISPLGAVKEIELNIPHGGINSVAINDSNRGIIGGFISAGQYNYGPAYAALVTPEGIEKKFELAISNSYIESVAISNFNQAIIGGMIDLEQNGKGSAYAAIIKAKNDLLELTLDIPDGSITSVAINDSNQGIIGGYNSSPNLNGDGNPYAALISPLGAVSPIDFNLSQGYIQSVAINNSNQGLIGGSLTLQADVAYAAIISLSNEPKPIQLSISGGRIQSVALNDFNYGLIGGAATDPHAFFGTPYAAMIFPDGVEKRIELSMLDIESCIVSDVAINNYNQGLISGYNYVIPDPDSGPIITLFAVLISPEGVATPIFIDPAFSNTPSVALNNSNLGIIGGGDKITLLSLIPTNSLQDNNLIFANYINQSAPQNVFDFIPAIHGGSLATALESASPVRNGIATYTASNNLFYATASLSTHLHKGNQSAAPNQPSSTIWFEAIGATSQQKGQNQTIAFRPKTEGGMLAVEKKMGPGACVGLGASYLHTHVHEAEKAGHIGIHQEDLFLYTSIKKGAFYFDGAILGGLYQAHQVRHIILPTFGTTTAASSSKGWQILPHGEVGLNFASGKNPQKVELTMNPFISVDWSNSWQKKVQETGNGSFNFCQKAHYSSLLRTEASIRLYQTVSFNLCTLTLQEKGGYVHKRSFGAGKVVGSLNGSTNLLTLETMSSAQNLGIVGAAMTLESAKSFLPAATLSYQGEFGRQFKSHQLSVEMAWNF